MIALAILLLVAAAAIVIWVIMGLNGNNANTIHFNAPGIDTDIKPLTLFLLGALALLLVWAATRLIAAGTKRKYRKHKETRDLKREHKEHEKLENRERKQREKHADAHQDVRPVQTEQREVVSDQHVATDHDVVNADSRGAGRHLDADQVKDTGRHYN